MRKMTKKEALASFREMLKESGQSLRSDRIALAEAWSNYTDMLCKDRQITLRQCETWTNPF